jgi:hypothetical protein
MIIEIDKYYFRYNITIHTTQEPTTPIAIKKDIRMVMSIRLLLEIMKVELINKLK